VNTEEKKEKSTAEIWLNEINEAVGQQAKELENVFNCKVEPFIFVIEPEKDAAVGFFKKPDAKQVLKSLRLMAADYENGIEMLAKAQLIRKTDLEAKQLEGTASDERFMDANGKYQPVDSDLQVALIQQARDLITIFSNQFKKK
jgi:hypothetical protein